MRPPQAWLRSPRGAKSGPADRWRSNAGRVLPPRVAPGRSPPGLRPYGGAPGHSMTAPRTGAERARCAYPQACRRAPAKSYLDARPQTANGVLPIPEGRQHRLGIRQQGAARLGKPRATTQAFEQGRAKFMLENIEAAADCGLRAVQPLGRAREAAKLRDSEEGLDLVGIHGSVFLMLFEHTMHWTTHAAKPR